MYLGQQASKKNENILSFLAAFERLGTENVSGETSTAFSRETFLVPDR